MLPGSRPERNPTTQCYGQARGRDFGILTDFIISGEACCWVYWQRRSPDSRLEGCVLPLWTILPSTSMFSCPSSRIKQTLFFAPQLLLQCSFPEREIGLHNQSVLVEVGKQRISWLRWTPRSLFAVQFYQVMELQGRKSSVWSMVWAAGVVRGWPNCCNVMLLPWLL